MCKTHQISDKLGVKLLNQLKADQILPLKEGPLEDGFYLVEKDGEKLVLQTGWSGELDDTPEFVGDIIEDQGQEYVLYEYAGKEGL